MFDSSSISKILESRLLFKVLVRLVYFEVLGFTVCFGFIVFVVRFCVMDEVYDITVTTFILLKFIFISFDCSVVYTRNFICKPSPKVFLYQG